MQTYSKFLLLSLLLLFSLVSCKRDSQNSKAIYFNGNILTMEDELRQVEAVLVQSGKIAALGNADSIERWQDESVEMVDLKGKTMLPGFIDAHSHFAIASQMMRQANVSSPPAGEVRNIAEMVSSLKNHREKNEIPEGDWVVGWGYDPDLLEEKRHPNKLDLDATFPNHPVFLLHVSAHMVVLNSKALAMLEIDENTKAPEGGVIVKLPDSKEPSGLLQEKMVEQVIKVLPRPSAMESLTLLEEAQDFYASRGITTAQDGLTDLPIFKALEKAAMLGYFTIDLEVLGSYRQADEWFESYKDKFGKNKNGLRLAGIKIVGDGSPQGKTAFFSKPYLTEVPGCVHTCRGLPTVTESQLDHILENAYAEDIQIYMHATGDSSIDMLLDAHEAAIAKVEAA
ncbi:MAG: amidohydrolase, partial [Chitinophagales bacterium]